MDNKSDENFIIMQSSIEYNKQEMKSKKKDSDEKSTKLSEESKIMFALILNQINTLSSSPNHKDTLNPP